MITLHIIGVEQGRFKGDKGADGEPVLCSHYSYDLTAPHDPVTHLPTGASQQGLVTIRKKLNPTSPQLAKACLEQEVLKEVRIGFSNPMRDPSARSPGTTTALRYFSIKLTQARIVSIKHSMTVELEPEPFEEVTFNFESIEYYSFIGGLGYNHPPKAMPQTGSLNPGESIPKPPSSTPGR
jgi:type VI secretion system Hcp family effector